MGGWCVGSEAGAAFKAQGAVPVETAAGYTCNAYFRPGRIKRKYGS